MFQQAIHLLVLREVLEQLFDTFLQWWLGLFVRRVLLFNHHRFLGLWLLLIFDKQCSLEYCFYWGSSSCSVLT